MSCSLQSSACSIPSSDVCAGGAGSVCSGGLSPLVKASQDFVQVASVPGVGNFQSQLQFDVNIPPGSFWDPSASFLELKLKIEDTVASDIPDFGGYSMNTVASLFESMTLTYNDTQVFTIASELPIADIMNYRIKNPNTVYDEDYELDAGGGNTVHNTKFENMFTSPTRDGMNPIEDTSTTLVWRPTVLRDISKLPAGQYRLSLTPSSQYKVRAFKAVNGKDSTTFAINGFGTGGSTANIEVAVEKVEFWALKVKDEKASARMDVSISVPSVQINKVTGKSYTSQNFSLSPYAKRVAVAYVDNRGDSDPRIDKCALTYYGAEADDVIPSVDYSVALNRAAILAKGVSKPNPDMELQLADQRIMYLYSQANAGHILTKERYSRWIERGQFMLVQVPQGNCDSDLATVRTGINNVADITHANLVFYQDLSLGLKFDGCNVTIG